MREATSGGWLLAECPFAEYLHQTGTDRNPSFYAKVDDAGYSGFHCFTCKQKGSIRALAVKLGYYRKVDYSNIALQAAINDVQDSFEDFESSQSTSAYEPTQINKLAYWAMYPCASTSEAAVAYLNSRRISVATAKVLELRFDPEEQRILFPVYCGDGKLYGLTGRSILSSADLGKSPKVKNYAGLKKEYRLLGEQLVPAGNDKPFLVVEGLFALAHLVELGVCNFCNPVAVMGSSLSEAQRDLLVGHDRPVYLCFDDDAAGSQGLFGAFKKDGKGYIGNGAVDKLRQHVPTMVCLYPLRTNEVDELNIQEVKRMIEVDYELA